MSRMDQRAPPVQPEGGGGGGGGAERLPAGHGQHSCSPQFESVAPSRKRRPHDKETGPAGRLFPAAENNLGVWFGESGAERRSGAVHPQAYRVDEVATGGSTLVHNGNNTNRLVRDESQCAARERLAPIWINLFDVRQHLSGYTCLATVD